MTKRIQIYGASDDLVEMRGDIEEEWGAASNGSFVVLSTGDVFSVIYCPGNLESWRVEHVVVSGECEVSIKRAPEGEDPDPYTDTANVVGPFTQADCWDSWPPDDEEVRERLGDRLDDLSGTALLSAYHATMG